MATKIPLFGVVVPINAGGRRENPAQEKSSTQEGACAVRIMAWHRSEPAIDEIPPPEKVGLHEGLRGLIYSGIYPRAGKE